MLLRKMMNISYLSVKQLSKGRVYVKRGKYGHMYTHLKVRALHKG